MDAYSIIFGPKITRYTEYGYLLTLVYLFITDLVALSYAISIKVLMMWRSNGIDIILYHQAEKNCVT